MKKIFAIAVIAILAIISSVSANAQWVSRKQAADELKGTSACTLYAYTSQNGRFVYWSDSNEVQIHTSSGIFDYEDKGGIYVTMNYVSVLIGFYKDGTLIEKVTKDFYVPDGDSNEAMCADELGRKIINHIENGGKVRFVASRYGRPDFDLTVSPRK